MTIYMKVRKLLTNRLCLMIPSGIKLSRRLSNQLSWRSLRMTILRKTTKSWSLQVCLRIKSQPFLWELRLIKSKQRSNYCRLKIQHQMRRKRKLEITFLFLRGLADRLIILISQTQIPHQSIEMRHLDRVFQQRANLMRITGLTLL